MPRHRQRRSLRFAQRGRCRWVELVTESYPAKKPRQIILTGRVRPAVAGTVLADFGNLGRTFRTSAESWAPRVLFFEEVAADPNPDDLGSGLAAWTEDVLNNPERYFDRLKSRRSLPDVQPLAAIGCQPQAVTAYVGVPLSSVGDEFGRAVRFLDAVDAVVQQRDADALDRLAAQLSTSLRRRHSPRC